MTLIRGAAGVLVLSLVLAAGVSAETLPRRLDYGWSLQDPSAGTPGAKVRRLRPGGPAETAGVRAGDIVLAVGAIQVDSVASLSALRFAGVAGAPLPVRLQRGADRVDVQLTPASAPRETYADIDTEWGEVAGAGGARLRTIATVPRGGGRLTAIFIAGWLSCDSVEVPPARMESTDQLIRDLITQSGAIVYRVDKPGLGDSEGVCATTDFTTELTGYQRAFAAMQKHPRVDPGRIVIVGISNGGGFAPLVAAGTPVLGYVTVGGWSKTWFEHMVDLERRRVVLSGTPPAQVAATLARLDEFHAAYLFDQLTPAEVMRARPQLRGVWYDEPDSQYGRPAAFYHQLQRLDLMAAWSTVRVPTLVVWGEYDWIMDRSDQELIVHLVNGDGVERASLYVAAKADHGLGTYPDRKAAFDGAPGGAYATDAGVAILRFIRRLL